MSENQNAPGPGEQPEEDNAKSKRAEKKAALETLEQKGLAEALEQHPNHRDELEEAYSKKTS